MPKVKTNDLLGAALDWAVAKCEGLLDQWGVCAPAGFRPSSDWAQGGPIIEQEKIGIYTQYPCSGLIVWYGRHKGSIKGYGSSPLIAAMRCYVASKLGDEVEVPDDLLC